MLLKRSTVCSSTENNLLKMHKFIYWVHKISNTLPCMSGYYFNFYLITLHFFQHQVLYYLEMSIFDKSTSLLLFSHLF